jgi:putative FmdB family regulatory protein
MPLYEYRCEACGAEEEAIESFSAPTEHACPACGAAGGMRRQLSKAGFVLSGGGWYSSGYGDTGKAAEKPAAKAESAPAAPASPADSCGGGCSCH